MQHPRGEASHHVPLPREGKGKVIANIFQHPIFGLRWTVSLVDPVDHSHMCCGLCRVVSREGDALQILKVR